jgi:Ubiquitin-binding domain
VDGCYDEAGNLYRLPEVVVSDPVNTVRGGDRQEEAMVDVGLRNSNNIDGETIIGVPDLKLATTPEEKLLHRDDGDVEKEDTDTLERRREEKGKASERDAVKVRCRLSDRGGPDVVIALAKTQQVATLVRRVQVEGKVCVPFLLSVRPHMLLIPDQNNAFPPPESGISRLANFLNPPPCHQQVSPSLHIRLAYLGKILNERDTLEAQGWKEGHVINAMVVGAES